MSWEVRFFQTTRGEYPVKVFMDEQNDATYAKILRSIRMLKQFGPYIKPPYSKKLYDDLFELRIQGKNALRILYTMTHNEYYLLHVFKKKTQKTPQKELQTALDRLKEII